MESSLFIGIILTLIAGLMSGNCLLPLKFLRSWKWENAWLVFSVVSLAIIPWALAVVLVRHLFETYLALSLHQLIIPILFGAGWGIAQILFGISVKRLGLGLAYAIIVGLGAAFGTLVPLFVQQSTMTTAHSVSLVIAGVAVMTLGICFTTWGGQIREHGTSGISENISRQGYPWAITLAVLCGVMAPMLNYSFAFGQDIAQKAIYFGNSPLHAAYAIWPIGLAGGLLPNVAYSLYLLSRNKTWTLFHSEAPDLLWSSLMGVLWMGAFALYGMSAIYLGALGTSIGWGLLQIFMIMTATLSGLLTGEWKRAPRSAVLLLGLGLASLTGSIILLAFGSRSP